jgi:hypothetical protein
LAMALITFFDGVVASAPRPNKFYFISSRRAA